MRLSPGSRTGRSGGEDTEARRALTAVAAPAVLIVVAAILLLGGAGSGAPSGTGRRAQTDGLAAADQGLVSAALGRHERGYRVVGRRARNPAQRLDATFSAAGVTVRAGSARAQLELVAVGRPGALQAITSASPRVTENRVDYARQGLDEWWVNGPLGLEQGFDVRDRPADGEGPWTISLALTGDLHASRDGAGAVLQGAGEVLRYGAPSATDARGRALPARLDVRPGRLVIDVDDRGAAYPVHVDPFLKRARMKASPGAG